MTTRSANQAEVNRTSLRGVRPVRENAWARENWPLDCRVIADTKARFSRANGEWPNGAGRQVGGGAPRGYAHLAASFRFATLASTPPPSGHSQSSIVREAFSICCRSSLLPYLSHTSLRPTPSSLPRQGRGLRPFTARYIYLFFQYPDWWGAAFPYTPIPFRLSSPFFSLLIFPSHLSNPRGPLQGDGGESLEGRFRREQFGKKIRREQAAFGGDGEEGRLRDAERGRGGDGKGEDAETLRRGEGRRFFPSPRLRVSASSSNLRVWSYRRVHCSGWLAMSVSMARISS